MEIRIKRIYEAPTSKDGLRALVDRVWPRGISKEKAAVDVWAKDLAPSTELRKWFNHDPAKWPEFKRRYHAELEACSERLKTLISDAGKGPLTLVYSARDENHNQAAALRHYLERRSVI